MNIKIIEDKKNNRHIVEGLVRTFDDSGKIEKGENKIIGEIKKNSLNIWNFHLLDDGIDSFSLESLQEIIILMAQKNKFEREMQELYKKECYGKA